MAKRLLAAPLTILIRNNPSHQSESPLRNSKIQKECLTAPALYFFFPLLIYRHLWVLIYLPDLIRASFVFSASEGMAHVFPTRKAPGIRLSLQSTWIHRIETPYRSAFCLIERYSIMTAPHEFLQCLKIL